jgi:type IV secretion system protein VirD4
VKEEREPHWRLGAEQLLVGVILHILYSNEDKSLAAVYDFLNSSDKKTMFETMLDTRHRDDMTHPAVATAARNMLNKPENELGSIVSTASTYVQLWQDPEMRKSTSVSDFMLEDIANSAKPVSLYIVVSNEDRNRMQPIVRLFFQMLGRKLSARLNANKHRVLLLLDEFPTLKRLEFVEEQIAYFAGYGVKCLLVCQSFNQLLDVYGQHTSIPDNCKNKIFLGADSMEDAERMSKYLGKQTVIRSSISRSQKISSIADTNHSDSESEAEKALRNPGEIYKTPYNEVMLAISGQNPYLGRKILYYQDPRFKPRTGLKAPDDPDQQVLEFPNRHQSPWDSFTIVPMPSSSAPRVSNNPVEGAGQIKKVPKEGIYMPTPALSSPGAGGGSSRAAIGRTNEDLQPSDDFAGHTMEHPVNNSELLRAVAVDYSAGKATIDKEELDQLAKPAGPAAARDANAVELRYRSDAKAVGGDDLEHRQSVL